MALRALNDFLVRDEGTETVMQSVGDGPSVARKRTVSENN
ncbi:protein of unknown function [Denitratisoma oestradiolicum]|uniref:Uncharacterized protein n=1 Tax=Denitratisoma oestradiolicum TaxID=311182 RepID=A0A6S6Y2Z9_9PROT|nr:protein of unknown function [Denitratisoma oestradiolicum]